MRVNDLFWVECAGARLRWKLIRSASVGWGENGERESWQLLRILAACADSGRLWGWRKGNSAHYCEGNGPGCGM